MPQLFRNANNVQYPNTHSKASNKISAIQPADFDSYHSVERSQGVNELYALSTDYENPDVVSLERVDDQLDLDIPISHLLAVAARRRAREATQANQTQ